MGIIAVLTRAAALSCALVFALHPVRLAEAQRTRQCAKASLVGSHLRRVEARLSAHDYLGATAHLDTLSRLLPLQGCDARALRIQALLLEARLWYAQAQPERALSPLLAADTTIESVLAEDAPLPLETSERFAAVYDLAAQVLIGISRHPDRAADGLGVNRLVAAIAAADRGRLQVFQRTYDRRRRTDAAKSSIRFVPNRFLPTEGDVNKLYREGNALINVVRADSAHLLYYLVTSDTLFILHRTARGGYYSYAVPVKAEHLAQHTQRLNSAMRAGLNGGSSAILDATVAIRALEALLLPAGVVGHMRQGDEVVVVPHGVLSLVPFDALSPPGGDPLLSIVSVRIAPALSLISAQHEYRQLRAVERMSAGAEPRGSSMRALVLTPHVRKVLLISPSLAADTLPTGGGAERGQMAADTSMHIQHLGGKQATLASLMRYLQGAEVVQFRTHAQVITASAAWLDSYISLEPSGDLTDGRLTARHVLEHWPFLEKELVVLTACETGGGSVQAAEGTLGLHWTFLANGAFTVVASLWPVEPAYADALMTQFYREWLSNGRVVKSKATALRAAKLTLLRESRDVWRWAAFQAYGSY